MTQKGEYENKVIEYLRRHKVLQTQNLAHHFHYSKRTIFRRLESYEYLTSYNKNGSGITLKDIPEFNTMGLWKYEGFMFSKFGTLKNTVPQVVEKSEAGLSAGELQHILQVQVYHHVSLCVYNGTIFRDTTWRYPIYYSIKISQREKQQKARKLLIEESTHPSVPPISKDKIIKMLVIAVKYHIKSVEKLMLRLESEGIKVSEKDVMWVFEKYEIEKKGFQ
jgi:hypothetical protein